MQLFHAAGPKSVNKQYRCFLLIEKSVVILQNYKS